MKKPSGLKYLVLIPAFLIASCSNLKKITNSVRDKARVVYVTEEQEQTDGYFQTTDRDAYSIDYFGYGIKIA